MSKRNITYVKPNEPKFLRKLKEEIGYKEGPTVDTKREKSDNDNKDFVLDLEEEQPQVVVLKPGDLTAEEAAKIKEDLEREVEETPADLSVPIVFKTPLNKNSATFNNRKRTISNNTNSTKTQSSSISSSTTLTSLSSSTSTSTASDNKKATATAASSSSTKRHKKSNKSLLSFDEDAEEEGED